MKMLEGKEFLKEMANGEIKLQMPVYVAVGPEDKRMPDGLALVKLRFEVDSYLTNQNYTIQRQARRIEQLERQLQDVRNAAYPKD